MTGSYGAKKKSGQTIKQSEKERAMPKEKVKHMTGVLASVFAHTGHITKEEAKEISGLEDSHFERVFNKAGNIAEKLMAHEGDKMEKLLEHFGEEIDEYMSFLM